MANKWWWRIPVILFCILMIATIVVFSKVAYAASGMPEFQLILNAAVAGLKEFFKFLLDLLIAVW